MRLMFNQPGAAKRHRHFRGSRLPHRAGLHTVITWTNKGIQGTVPVVSESFFLPRRWAVLMRTRIYGIHLDPLRLK